MSSLSCPWPFCSPLANPSLCVDAKIKQVKCELTVRTPTQALRSHGIVWVFSFFKTPTGLVFVYPAIVTWNVMVVSYTYMSTEYIQTETACVGANPLSPARAATQLQTIPNEHPPSCFPGRSSRGIPPKSQTARANSNREIMSAQLKTLKRAPRRWSLSVQWLL